MVVIRLARGGSKNRPYYYIMVADSRKRKEGRFIEKIGFYNPVANEKTTKFHIDNERFAYWTGVGAQPSSTVKNLVKKQATPTATVVDKATVADKATAVDKDTVVDKATAVDKDTVVDTDTVAVTE